MLRNLSCKLIITLFYSFGTAVGLMKTASSKILVVEKRCSLILRPLIFFEKRRVALRIERLEFERWARQNYFIHGNQSIIMMHLFTQKS